MLVNPTVRHKEMIRVILQLLLAFPIFIISPLALLMAVIPFSPSFWGEILSGRAENFLSAAVLACGAYGILALPFAIFVPLALVRRKKWLRVLLVAALTGGCITAVYTFSRFHPGQYDWEKNLSILWIYGGPLIVAIWTLVRYLKPEPNKPLQGTEGKAPSSSTEPEALRPSDLERWAKE